MTAVDPRTKQNVGHGLPSASKNKQQTLVLVTLPSSSARWCWDSVRLGCPAAICSSEQIFKHAMMLLSVLCRVLSHQESSHVWAIGKPLLSDHHKNLTTKQNLGNRKKLCLQNQTAGLLVPRLSLWRVEVMCQEDLVQIQDTSISSSPHCTWESWSLQTGHFASLRVWKAWMNNLIVLGWLWDWKNKSEPVEVMMLLQSYPEKTLFTLTVRLLLDSLSTFKFNSILRWLHKLKTNSATN